MIVKKNFHHGLFRIIIVVGTLLLGGVVMNKAKIAREGEKWVEDGHITEEQLEAILSTYQQKDHRYLLVLFATLLVSIGVLIYGVSDWAQVSNSFRIGIMVVSMIVLYSFGAFYYRRHEQQTDMYPQIVSMSFLLLGYVFFGATILLLIHLYGVVLLSAWPYAIWGIAGLLLYFLYPHQLTFLSGLVIITYGQIYSSLAFDHFNVSIFVIFLFGFIIAAYRHNSYLFSSSIAIAFVIHSLVTTSVLTNEYYWFILFMFILYTLSEIISRQTLQGSFFYVSVFSIFIFKTSETFMLQEDYFSNELIYEPAFFIILGSGIVGMLFYSFVTKESVKLVDISLFIPLFFLPYHYLIIILSMFFFSLFYLIYGFQRGIQYRIVIGIVTFLLSTFTVYIQYAWETLNKSLFFIIGGLLLFGISFVLEKLRRNREQGED